MIPSTRTARHQCPETKNSYCRHGSKLVWLMILGFSPVLSAADAKPTTVKNPPAAKTPAAKTGTANAAAQKTAGAILFLDDSETGQNKTWDFSVKAGFEKTGYVLFDGYDDPPEFYKTKWNDFAQAKVIYRLINDGNNQLSLKGGVSYGGTPKVNTENNFSYSAEVKGQTELSWFDPLCRAYVTRYTQANTEDYFVGESTVIGVEAGGARLSENLYHLDRLTTLVERVDYDLNPDNQGMRYTLNYKHWFMLEPAMGRRRIEFTCKVITYRAETDPYSYDAIQPGLGFNYRFGANLAEAGVYDLRLFTTLEFRKYEDKLKYQKEVQKTRNWVLGCELKRWMAKWAYVGISTDYQRQMSNLPANTNNQATIALEVGLYF